MVVLFVAVLLLHAANYGYFFVDDEAIPYVYAQNLLNGNGLTYDSFEGPVEGYSNLLLVFEATAMLEAARLLGLSKMSVFAAGKLVSLCAGAGIIAAAFLTLRKVPRIRVEGLVAGLSFLALAGPLAVWCCSSLEEVTFGFVIASLLYRLVVHVTGGRLTKGAAAFAAAAVLLRIDGVLYVTVVAGMFLLVANRAQRKALWTGLVLPSLAVFALYQAWRVWYFGEWLSMPIYAKVLYKLNLSPNLVTKPPAHNYAVAFLDLYGLIPFALLSLAWLAHHRDRLALACLLATAALLAYLALVGDWMFGFRFFVPVLPLLALLVAYSISALADRVPRGGWVAVAACIAWFSTVALAFNADYQRSEHHDSWLLHPTLNPRRHFSRYYSLVEETRGYVRAGDVLAYNQAGLLAFLSGVNNIDSLGICTKFFAKLPTTDVAFTEVGRYEPLTNKPALHAGQAYLLYRAPRLVIEPVDLLQKANANRIPGEVLAGRYRLLFVDAVRQNAVYIRTDRSVGEFRTEPRRFLENLAHVSHLKTASVNGVPVDPTSFMRAFPWLREGDARFTVGASHVVELEFSSEDISAYEFHIDAIASSRPVRVSVMLRSHDGRVGYRTSFDLRAGEVRDFREYLREAVTASRLTLEFAATASDPARVLLSDVRLQGQTRALAAYVRETLRFASGEPAQSSALR